MPRESVATVTKRRLLGVVFIVIVLGLISLSVAIYNKTFTKTVDVTLEANHTGNQLLLDSDVKVRGLIVGSVRGIEVDGDLTKVKLSLEPGRASQIPADVSAQILPKTLFGEQYVALILPKGETFGSGRPLADGGTIRQDRSKGALEAQTVLDHLFPVLTAVDPADLNATLTAVATALKGRGNQLGETLVNMDKYLEGLNPHTQQLVDDLEKLGKVALEYDDVSPDLFDSLKNLQTSARTVIEKRQAIDDLFTTGADTSVTLSGFLDRNKQRLIRVTGQTAAIYPRLAEYSPEFTCLFAGVNNLVKSTNKAIYDNQIHLGVTLDVTNQGKYSPGEYPRLVTGYGPNCFGLPDNPQPKVNGNFQIPGKYRCLNDGAPLTEDSCARSPSAAGRTMLNSAGENALVNNLIAGELHTTPDKVPAAATIMAGPLLRGQEVSLE